ncbi:MAG TPA: Wadjet anti-phage system protein JetD domain-containing protein [Verrucomicrobiae bacterium]|nr:Wadjet anti-phage system protein JetD domain-containing protein [Verrucomicrobiae bacterium]
MIAPIKERSLQIFGDEKRLDYLLDSALFREGRLSLELLACEIVGQPFGWKRGPVDTGKILVVENAATWHSYARWNSEKHLFTGVVYGCGNCFLENIRHLADILAEFSSPQRIFYFGDLDYQGLRIPIEASKRAIKIGLPSVEPDLWSYGHLLKVGQPQEVEYDSPEASAVVGYEWLAHLAKPARALLEAGNRLAQEHIGLEFLSDCHDDWRSV